MNHRHDNPNRRNALRVAGRRPSISGSGVLAAAFAATPAASAAVR
jgi:hypothetical protein